VAGRLRGFDAEVVAIGRRDPDAMAAAIAQTSVARYRTLDGWTEELVGAMALIVCIRMTDATRGLVGSTALDKLGRDGLLINVARGGVVDYSALSEALAAGRLGGAGLDVFWDEPIAPDDPLLGYNVTLTPHIGGVTDRSYALMSAAVADNITRFKRGMPLENRLV
jgi:phosphoglycerate dehydrogenase-like enzyme